MQRDSSCDVAGIDGKRAFKKSEWLMGNRIDQCVLPSLASGGGLLASSVLIKHAWRERFGRWQRETVWQAPAIWSWKEWVQELWQACCHDGGDVLGENGEKHRAPWLLNDAQSMWLWQDILAQEIKDSRIRNDLALRAMQTWRLCQQWESGCGKSWKEDKQQGGSWEQRQFWRWRERYESLLQERGWLDVACLENCLQGWLTRDGVRPGQLAEKGGLSEIWLAGFANKLSPAGIGLLRALRSKGIRLRALPHQGVGELLRLDAGLFESEEEELLAAARWARALALEQPELRIGLAMLKPQEAWVRRLLEQVLQPGKLPGDTSRSAFHISDASSLGETPLVSGALGLLRLQRQWVCDPEAISCLLTDRQVAGWQEEHWVRMRYWQCWGERSNLEDISLEKLPELLQDAQQLSQQVDDWLKWMKGLSQRASFAEWAGRFHKSLGLLGWMKQQPQAGLDSVAHQALGAWSECLETLATLGLVHSRDVSWKEAWQALEGVVLRRNFRPQSPKGPISVVRLQEAAGLEFDYLWVLGLHSENWPLPEEANIFLPFSWQRERGMPGSSIQTCLASARRITARLSRSAGQVIFSSAAHVHGVPTTPSPLLQHLLPSAAKQLPAPQAAESRTIECLWQSAPPLERREDAQAPPLAKTHLQGGVQLLRDQSACPFQGFAYHRLGLRSPSKSAKGWDAAAQGQLLHQALKLFWEKAGDSDVLKKTPDELKSDIQQAVAKAMETNAIGYSPWLQRQEQQRLEQMMWVWLQKEKDSRQGEAFRIHQLEYSLPIDIGPLQLTGRIDRIDQLEGGALFLLDYKTGTSASSQHWLGERPQEPQLPLYALQLAKEKKPLAGFGFAHIHEDSSSIKANFHVTESSQGQVLKISAAARKPPPLDELLVNTGSKLDQLAKEFANGKAQVAPRPQACQQCHLQMLCRVHQHSSSQ